MNLFAPFMTMSVGLGIVTTPLEFIASSGARISFVPSSPTANENEAQKRRREDSSKRTEYGDMVDTEEEEELGLS
jgi:hypothetical protein